MTNFTLIIGESPLININSLQAAKIAEKCIYSLPKVDDDFAVRCIHAAS